MAETQKCDAVGRFAKRGGGGLELGCQLDAGHEGQHERRVTDHPNGLYRWGTDFGPVTQHSKRQAISEGE